MEPNNFERQLKQKLENSTIQPSGKSLGSTKAMLDTADKVKGQANTLGFIWLQVLLVC
jgi:hypothetical protein